MESLKNAANAAASYVGYDATGTNEKAAAGDQLGELLHNKNSTQTAQTSTSNTGIAGGQAPRQTHGSPMAQSGVEPVSGRLGSGVAGEPYDAGNEDGMIDILTCLSG